MIGLNKMTVIGNLGTDCEMRFTPSGAPVSSFRIATSRSYTTPDGEKKQETEWFDVVTWNRLAENCNQFLTKGQRAYVEGRIRTRSWEGQDGQKHSRIEIIANRVIFLDKRQVDATSEAGAEGETDKDVEVSDIPF